MSDTEKCKAVITKTMEAMAANRAGLPRPRCSRAAHRDGYCYQHHPDRASIVAEQQRQTAREVAAMYERYSERPPAVSVPRDVVYRCIAVLTDRAATLDARAMCAGDLNDALIATRSMP